MIRVCPCPCVRAPPSAPQMEIFITSSFLPISLLFFFSSPLDSVIQPTVDHSPHLSANGGTLLPYHISPRWLTFRAMPDATELPRGAVGSPILHPPALSTDLRGDSVAPTPKSTVTECGGGISPPHSEHRGRETVGKSFPNHAAGGCRRPSSEDARRGPLGSRRSDAAVVLS
jgi:hypothetical protein